MENKGPTITKADLVQQMNAQDGSWDRLARGDYNGWWVEDKFDGERWTGWHTPWGEVIIYSRHINEELDVNTIKSDNVPHLVKVLKQTPPDTIVDGELVFMKDGKISFQGVRQLMGCKIPGKAVERQRERGWMTFILFDLLRLGGVDFTKEDNQTRRSALELLYYRLENVDDRLAEFEYLQIADRFPLEQAEERFAEVVALGGEGIMLKNPLACYKPGTRPSKTWLKLKRKDTFDAVIMGFEAPSTWYAEPGMTGKDGIFYPEGRHTRFYMNGWIGAIIYGQYKDGQLVRMGRSSGINDEMREAMSNNQERYIGQVAEFACMGRNSKGASRHPAFKRMRPDKNASQCVFEEKALYDAWS